ncbi:hypothetical protein [Halarsenatibacter silvermanii]|uniref:Uncharacterized protein n=1 Tax=Halarsenatibacter silvermanii TaxID=321763 RepID=A0A1G9TI36_9FIRM|nr:hypothetical protein [Halarsenatibacter silvermanii]SDM47272.1 hypothetical protein SAMN04488692_1403 [Halarsenatibacter silvermanii]
MSKSEQEYIDIEESICQLMGRKTLLAKTAKIYEKDYQSQLDQLQRFIEQKIPGRLEMLLIKLKAL